MMPSIHSWTSSGLRVPVISDMTETMATGPGSGLTNLIGMPFSAATAASLFHNGAIAISPRSIICARIRGLRPATGSSSFSFFQPGSKLDSEPPKILLMTASVPRPRLEEVRQMPRMPAYSSFHMSAQLVGGVFTSSSL